MKWWKSAEYLRRFETLREETEVERVSMRIDWVKELTFEEKRGMKEDEEIVVGNIGVTKTK